MNLLHVTPYYAPAWYYGGVVRAVTDLTKAQAEAGHQVIVLTTDTLGPSQRVSVRQESRGGVSVFRARNLSNRFRSALNLSTPVRFGARARQLIREYDIDLVHCHELRTMENLSVVRAVRSLNRPVVISPHGTLSIQVGRSRLKRLWDLAFGEYLLPSFDHIMALTEMEADEIRKLWASRGIFLDRGQISVVPNGIFPDAFAQLPSGDRFRRQWGLGTGPVIVFLGRLAERKGLQILLPAFAQAAGNVPDARLLIVGPDNNMRSRLDGLVAKHHLVDRVIFTGLLEDEDKRAALAASDIFALPAIGEGFSMAVLEAMACRLPVLLTVGCNFPEVAEAGAGLIVPREIAALGEALHVLLLDPDRRATMGRRAFQFAQARFSWTQIVAQLDAIYTATLRQHSGHPQERACDPDS